MSHSIQFTRSNDNSPNSNHSSEDIFYDAVENLSDVQRSKSMITDFHEPSFLESYDGSSVLNSPEEYPEALKFDNRFIFRTPIKVYRPQEWFIKSQTDTKTLFQAKYVPQFSTYEYANPNTLAPIDSQRRNKNDSWPQLPSLWSILSDEMGCQMTLNICRNSSAIIPNDKIFGTKRKRLSHDQDRMDDYTSFKRRIE
ncbi:hypothetical protein G9A89_009219 [Geosiphon pyriformis]|nr:hypothetical protein G9A89_009219 [Geosiphon pyriformis]